ncbi:MAG: hypothetical protein ACR2RA_22585 [Geminicoccaceae bacterium]
MSEYEQEKMESASESRREALKQFGRYAAATTPAMLMLLDSNRQEASAHSRKKHGRHRHPHRGGHTSKATVHPKKKDKKKGKK